MMMIIVREMKEVRGAGPGRLDRLAFAQHLCNTELNTRAIRGTNQKLAFRSRDRPRPIRDRGYGAWYMAPSQWNEKLKKSSQTNMDCDKYSLCVLEGEF